MNTSRLIQVAMLTDEGMVRSHNEDFVICWEPANPDDEQKNGSLYIVADGVGGADAGEVASQFASERTIQHYLETEDEEDLGQRLWKAMHSANTDLRLMAMEQDNTRMATTMVAAIIHNGQAHITNVGDSRGYLYRAGQLTQITKDQSLVAKLVEEGAITEEEAENHPRKNVILYSIGSEDLPKIDLFQLELQSDDILLLCSDGLTRHVSNQEIGDIASTEEPNTAVEKLVHLANNRGGEDNITVTIIRYDPQAPQARPYASTQKKNLVDSKARLQLWVFTLFLSLTMSSMMLWIWYSLQ